MLGKFLTVDPGEDTGWSLWDGTKLLDSGTEKMWAFSDAIWETALLSLPGDILGEMAIEPSDLTKTFRGLNHVVCENWTLYPWDAMAGNLNWDECRTARLIGSITAACRLTGWIFELQPAKIKERALAAGAAAYFEHPLKENRHANDAKMHGVFRNAIEAGAPWADLSKNSWEAE